MAGVQQVGHYAKGELQIVVEHDGTVLAELDDFSWDIDPKVAPGGAGLGDLKHKYWKRTDAPVGTWSVGRKLLARADKGGLFLDLLKGSAYILTEYVAPAAGTHTPAETLVSIIHVRTRTAGTCWVEGVDFTVNYATGVITFVSTVPAGGLEVKYLTTTASLISENKLSDPGFEEAITNIWEAVGTATVSQDGANELVGDYALKVDVVAQNDGAKHVPDIVVTPGKVYRLRAWVKGTATDTFGAKWTDSGGASDMTADGSVTLSGSSYQEMNWTFTPDEETILDVQIINTKATTPSDFYLDEVYLGENAPTINPLDGNQNPFTFNVIVRRRVDSVTVAKFVGCAVHGEGGKAGEAWTETISGGFLNAEFEAD